MDTEIDALSGEIDFYNNHTFSTQQSNSAMLKDILTRWDFFNTIPITEFSHNNWDKLNYKIEQLLGNADD